MDSSATALKSKLRKTWGTKQKVLSVSKLLTGFDAPSCTYIYLDKKLQDHGLFQAICRTNRLDGDDKTFGYIVDYENLFSNVQAAISVYTSELAQDNDGKTPEICLQDRLTAARETLENAREAVFHICEPVEPPKNEQDYIHYFCGNTELPKDFEETTYRRNTLYQGIAILIRAYGQIANELDQAGYSQAEVQKIKQEVTNYTNIRETIRRASGEYLDVKPYEADMRHLIDTYIEADEPRKISEFEQLPLLDLIVKTTIEETIENLPPGIKKNQNSVAETIENNVRRIIVQEQINDPAFYCEMSQLLDAIIAERKQEGIVYEELLRKYADLAQKIKSGETDDLPPAIDTPGKLALYNNLNQNLDLALDIDAAVKQVRPDGWRGEKPRENVIKKELNSLLNQDLEEVERIFAIIVNQQEY